MANKFNLTAGPLWVCVVGCWARADAHSDDKTSSNVKPLRVVFINVSFLRFMGFDPLLTILKSWPPSVGDSEQFEIHLSRRCPRRGLVTDLSANHRHQAVRL